MAALLVLVLIAVLLFCFTPRSTRIRAEELEITSPLHIWRFPLADILHAEPARLQPFATFRLAAIGWPLPPSGWLWSRQYGRFRALASSRRNLCLLTFRNGSRLLVSLADPAALGIANPPPSSLNGYTASMA